MAPLKPQRHPTDQLRFSPLARLTRQSFVKIATLVLVGIAIVMVSGGCEKKRPSAPGAAPSKPDSRVVLRLGYRPKALVDITPIVMAETKAAGKHLRLEFVPVASPPEGFARLNANEVDALAGMPTEAIFSQIAGETGPPRFKAYAAEVDLRGAGWVAVVASRESGVKSMADLAGKTVASLPTDQANWLLKRLLLAAGVPADQVKLARYNTANPVAGLRSGEHAAIFGPEPATSLALANGGVLLELGPLSKLLYDGKPVPVAMSIVKSDWASSHPEAFAELQTLVDEAAKYAQDHTDEVRAYFAKAEYGGLAPEVRAILEFPVMRRPDAEILGVTRRFIDDLVRDGLLKQPIDPSSLF